MMREFSFHESTVINFALTNNQMIIDLEDVLYDISKIKVRVKIEDVLKILIDSVPSEIVTMPTSDGEVLSLEINESTLFVLIEWNDFVKGDSFTHSYHISGEKITVIELKSESN